VLTPFLETRALHGTLRTSERQYAQLAAAYKQIDAGVGAFAAATLELSEKGVSSTSAGDATYRADEATLATLGNERDALAGQIAAALDGAATGRHRISDATADRLVEAAHLLISQTQAAAA
jgi:hypothetical protein